ncbi:hypothetical protein BC833DRAFT_601548 [Globomyces pollinis-pini]|nr:hypothetical protein BC833DRAFT_601548 [Globomyces pollinis-pini]
MWVFNPLYTFNVKTIGTIVVWPYIYLIFLEPSKSDHQRSTIIDFAIVHIFASKIVSPVNTISGFVENLC